jgi:Na+-driven multidrug efflux pump
VLAAKLLDTSNAFSAVSTRTWTPIRTSALPSHITCHRSEERGRLYSATRSSITSFDDNLPPKFSRITENSKDELLAAPSVNKILRFAIPAIGVWLCSPLLSLIDTSVVGLFSGTSQQAALNPAVSVTEYAALLIAFMYTGTTNLVSIAQEKDRLTDRRGGSGKQTAKTFKTALQLSGFVGAALGTLLFTLSVPLLRAIVGDEAIDPHLFEIALKYVRIRALGMPGAAIIGTSQAACLGMKDIKSPFYVLLAAAFVNFLGDVCFVGNSHPWIGGAPGAAWATVISQYAAVAFFLRWLIGKDDKNGSPKADHSQFFPPVKRNMLSSAVNNSDPPAKGFLRNQFRSIHFFHLPSDDEIFGFVPYIVPVTSTQVGRVSSYVAMSHVTSSALGTTSMAAQQVIISLWNCLYPVGESLSLTAQSFVPSILERSQNMKDRAIVLRKTIANFWKAGLVFGSGLFATVLCIPFLNPLFTSDPTVMAQVNSVVPLLLVIFSTLGLFTSSEGILLGQQDLGFLGKSYASFFFIIPYFMLRVKRAALASPGGSLRSVWTVFTYYQIFRTVVWMLRAQYLRKHQKVPWRRRLSQSSIGCDEIM